MRTKFEIAKKKAVESVQNSKKLSSQFKTQKGEKAVESVQNSEVQEDAGQRKKAVGDRVEFTSKLKKGVESH